MVVVVVCFRGSDSGDGDDDDEMNNNILLPRFPNIKVCHFAAANLNWLQLMVAKMMIK